MDSLFLETNNLLEHVQRALATLERATNADQAQQIDGHISKQLDLILSNCERLDALVSKEPPARRRNAKYRVDQLKYDAQHVRSSVYNLQQKLVARWRNEQEREELLNRRFTANDSTTISLLDGDLDHHNRLLSMDNKMDGLISTGYTALENLRWQGKTLKGARKRMLDFANTLGLSNLVMRRIETRTFQDKIILFGGMIVTLIIMFLLYKWLKG